MTLRTELGRILITGAGGRVATAFRQAMSDRYALRRRKGMSACCAIYSPATKSSASTSPISTPAARPAPISTPCCTAADPPRRRLLRLVDGQQHSRHFQYLPRGERRRLPPGGVRQQRAGGGRLSARLPNPPGRRAETEEPVRRQQSLRRRHRRLLRPSGRAFRPVGAHRQLHQPQPGIGSAPAT